MKVQFRPFMIAALLLASAVALPASALSQAIEPGQEGELAKLVQPREGERACFGRVYDAQHLAKHPKQKVTEMEFRLAYYVHEPDEFSPKGQRNYYFELLAKLRGNARQLTSMGECTPTEDGKRIFCGVDCDGGGFGLAQRAGGKVLIDMEMLGRLRMSLGCGEDEGDSVELTPGEDDKQFLLTRTASCPGYEEW